jgi:hypothetical protein
MAREGAKVVFGKELWAGKGAGGKSYHGLNIILFQRSPNKKFFVDY